MTKKLGTSCVVKPINNIDQCEKSDSLLESVGRSHLTGKILFFQINKNSRS